MIPASDMLHYKGMCLDNPLVGVSPIVLHAETLGIDLAAISGNAGVYKNGVLKFLLTSEAQIKPEQAAPLKQSLDDVIDGAARSAVLPNGVKMERLSLSPDEAKYLETRKYDAEEIARIFGVPASMIGAALVSRNIAQHLEQHFADKPKSYRPLVYCWRGGSRSGSMTHILHKIGFASAQLEGGYKAYRRQVIADLAALPAKLSFRVVTGPTGSGKSRLLQALAALGAQVLDLEELAAHRGSILGSLPGQPQPTQKSLESKIWHRLRQFQKNRPVYVESESRKIGMLRVPEELITCMRASPCLRLEVPLSARIDLLIEEYQHYLDEPRPIIEQLALLIPLRGRETVEYWQGLAQAGNWPGLFAALLE